MGDLIALLIIMSLSTSGLAAATAYMARRRDDAVSTAGAGLFLCVSLMMTIGLAKATIDESTTPVATAVQEAPR